MAKRKQEEVVVEEVITEVEVPKEEVKEEVKEEEKKEFIVSSGRTYQTRAGIVRTDN